MLKNIDAKSHGVEAETKMRQEIVAPPAAVVNIKNGENLLVNTENEVALLVTPKMNQFVIGHSSLCKIY